MLIMNAHGHFSVVEFQANPELVTIRTRCREHLEAFLSNLSSVTGRSFADYGMPNADIHRAKGEEYLFHTFAPKSLWAEYLSGCAMATDYPNFWKEAAIAGSPEYMRFLAEVESDGARMQSAADSTPEGEESRGIDNMIAGLHADLYGVENTDETQIGGIERLPDTIQVPKFEGAPPGFMSLDGAASADPDIEEIAAAEADLAKATGVPVNYLRKEGNRARLNPDG